MFITFTPPLSSSSSLFDNEQIFIFQKKKKKKRRRRRKFSKKALRLRALGSYFLVACKKKIKININQNFQFLEKFKISKIFKKNSSIKIFNSLKNSRFLIFFFFKKKSLWIRGIGLVLLRQLKKKTKIFIKFFFRNRKLWSSSMSTVHPQRSSKHGICPKLRASARYAEFFSMNNSVTNWKCLFCRY